MTANAPPLTRRWRGGIGAFRLPLLYLAVIAAPLAFLVLVQVFSEDELPGVTSNPQPVVTEAAEREVRDSQGVSLTLEWTEGRDLLAPPWSGTVQAILIEPGATLTSGQRIVTIDGVDRFVYATAQPFYRSLRSGDTGADVEQLNQMLLAMGYMASETWSMTTYTYDTYLAVYALEGDLGVARPTGVFDHGLVAWLPASPFDIVSLDLVVSASAPGAGQAFAGERSRLTSAEAAATQPGTTLSFEPGVEYVLLVEGERLAIDPATATVPPEALAALEAIAEPPSGDEQPSQPGFPGGGGGGGLSGTVERATPLHSRAVPATAVMVNSAGALCVWTPDGAAYRAVPVRVQGSRAGVTDVIEGLEAGERVLANPADILPDPSCPSS